MNRNRLFILLALFFSVFLICAGLLQLRSGLPPQKGGGAVDQLNGALLWTTSIMALLIASTRARPAWKFLFWLGVCAGFAALAIDEVFEFHEGTRVSLGDDDYIKIAAWFCAIVGVFLIHQVARPARTAMTALVIALLFQTLWLLSDMGDGDFFSVPVPLANLYWLEEYFEMLGSMFYFIGLFAHYQDEFAITAAQPVQSQPKLEIAAAVVGSRATLVGKRGSARAVAP